jgi:glycogen debranching enzyme
MAEVVNFEETFAIVSEAERPSASVRVLKHNDTFAVFDPHGNITPGSGSPYGLYHGGTRFLSRLDLRLGSREPLLLSSTIGEDNCVFNADLTNPDILHDSRITFERGVFHLFRSRVLWDGRLLERLRVSNHGLRAFQIPIALRFESDFADVFEVRGTRRVRHGQRLPDEITTTSAVLAYQGLDRVWRRTQVRLSPAATRIDAGAWVFLLTLEPQASAEIEVAIACEIEDAGAPALTFDDAVARGRARHALGANAQVVTSDPTFNRWIRRSFADLGMLATDTPTGTYPYAGIPWFSTPFGRDGILTALELLWLAPDIARGVLLYLAATQATEVNDAQDAQPGKILHERREGEMAALGEIPFGRYYGSADATPLFVVLAHEYFERTGDRATIDAIWPNLVAALQWIESYGDLDGDGFVEYSRASETGLVQQGWKDSWDSVFHADGRLAEPPIALCELQGYAYAAWTGAAQLAAGRGAGADAERWRGRAESLRQRFEQAFWCEELGTYALALDGGKRPCRVRTSNPGHCLFTGIVAADRSRRVADTLLDVSSFSGWGVRTVASGTARYNPMSYHNGSVWPHDNALIAAGLARYGHAAHALRVLDAMFDLSRSVDLHRLPELICGFHRRQDASPTLYPVACAPQAWAAGAVSLLLQACLGIRVDAPSRRLSFAQSRLPEQVEWVRIHDLRVGEAHVDLLLTRHPHDVGITVLQRRGDVEIVALK